MSLLVISSIMTTYFLLIRTQLSSLFFLKHCRVWPQVCQRKQPRALCAVFLTAESSHCQHRLQVSSDRISPSVFGKLKATLSEHRNMLLYKTFDFPHPHLQCHSQKRNNRMKQEHLLLEEEVAIACYKPIKII